MIRKKFFFSLFNVPSRSGFSSENNMFYYRLSPSSKRRKSPYFLLQVTRHERLQVRKMRRETKKGRRRKREGVSQGSTSCCDFEAIQSPYSPVSVSLSLFPTGLFFLFFFPSPFLFSFHFFLSISHLLSHGRRR